MKIFSLFAFALCFAIASAWAQQAETIPLTVDDGPYLQDITAARQRVTFSDPVYARMWIEVTEGSTTRPRAELILPEAHPLIVFKALLLRSDFFPDRPPVDNHRIRLEMQTNSLDESDGSYTLWTNNEGVTFPPLPNRRLGAVSIAVKLPAERPLETDCLVMSINETLKDANGAADGARKIDVKVRFSKTAFQPVLK